MCFVVDDGSTKTSCRVDAGASDGNGGQVDEEDSKPNWQGSKDLHQICSNKLSIYLRKDCLAYKQTIIIPVSMISYMWEIIHPPNYLVSWRIELNLMGWKR